MTLATNANGDVIETGTSGCHANNCDRSARCRGLCDMHYRRLLHHGTTELSTVVDKFWSNVDKSGACWLWTAYVARDGYGRYRGRGALDGMSSLVHRVAYELLVGPVPEGLELDHLCRVRHCVNPDHLEPVTHAENVRRGEGPTRAATLARSATHCKRGHEFTAENTYVVPSTGRRSCHICRRILRRRAAAAQEAR